MRAPIRFAGMVALTLVLCVRLHAAASQMSFVPWKVLEPGAEPARKAFILFWIPTSPEEMRHSELITSQRLTLYAGRCIGMDVVRADDASMLEKLRVGDGVPLAVLCEDEKEVARVLADAGVLNAGSVEAMVRQAFDSREAALNAMLDRAGAKASAGENAGAIELYQEVAAQGCAFPRLAKTAQRALRRLGVKN
ncbi:MAG TPA: hypothetical protein VF505_11290 [Thermoanaerobaculia bacterium]